MNILRHLFDAGVAVRTHSLLDEQLLHDELTGQGRHTALQGRHLVSSRRLDRLHRVRLVGHLQYLTQLLHRRRRRGGFISPRLALASKQAGRAEEQESGADHLKTDKIQHCCFVLVVFVCVCRPAHGLVATEVRVTSKTLATIWHCFRIVEVLAITIG